MVSSRIPTVRLGQANSGEQLYFQLEELNGIKIWYARNIRPEAEGHPIHIALHKVFLGYKLKLENAKIDIVTS